MKVGQVAEAADVSAQTVRFYERRGLLAAPPRTASGYRAYGPGAVEEVRFIKRAQAHGFTLREIRELQGLRDASVGCEAAIPWAREKLAELDQRMEALTRLRAELAALLETCAGGACGLLQVSDQRKQRP